MMLEWTLFNVITLEPRNTDHNNWLLTINKYPAHKTNLIDSYLGIGLLYRSTWSTDMITVNKTPTQIKYLNDSYLVYHMGQLDHINWIKALFK